MKHLENSLNEQQTHSTRTATLSFSLPAENHAFKMACNAEIYRQAIQEALNFIRSKSKYDDNLTDSENELLHEVKLILLENLSEIGDDI